MSVERRAAQPPGKRLGARRDPETFEKHTLRREARSGKLRRGARQRLEIDMRGKIGLSGGGERVHWRMGFQRLQRIAERAPVAVVEDQRAAAVGSDAAGDLAHDRRRGGADLHQTILGHVVAPGKLGRHIGRAEAKGERAAVEAHQTLAPCPAGSDKLADRKRVEKLVGDDKERGLGERARAVMMGDLMARQRRALLLAQGGRGFDEMHPERGVKPGHHLGGAQDIGHQRAATGAKLGQRDGAGRALIHPGLRERQPHKLAEHLADLRRGNEIACRAKRVAGGVIAPCRVQKALGHELGQGDRPGLYDPGAERRAEAHARARRVAQISVSTPATIIGTLSTWPIVIPIKTWPIGLSGVMYCASASRKNSTMKRASP